MPTWYYFSRPINLAYHDLTSFLTPPKNLRSLLGLGSKFIPTPRHTKNWSSMRESSFERLDRDLRLRSYFAGEGDNDDTDYNPKMYIKSKWTPPPWKFPRELPPRLDKFDATLAQIFKKRHGRPNLLPHQRRALTYLQTSDEFLIVNCDKNLGPAIIEKTSYIQMAYRDHFNDRTSYRRLSPNDVALESRRLKTLLNSWRSRFNDELSKQERKFLKTQQNLCIDPFPAFYLTMKVHKKPLKSRPIVSCSGSLLEGLGIWVDAKMQPLARRQKSYFKSSFDLVQELKPMNLPPSARFFTADAVSMYTNIPTSRALLFISRYLRRNAHRFDDLPVLAFMEALRMIMTNNIFSFGDTHWKQICGTAMGTPPAPPYATLYYALLEDSFIDEYPRNLLYYRRFIDDVIGIWDIVDPATNETPWSSFKQRMNDPIYELEWEHSDLVRSIDFMDLTISITDDGKISTTLYQKPSNLHLYIPPHSAHPPGLLTGMVFGTVHRIRTLCSDPSDQKTRLRDFFRHLQDRGYKPSSLVPLFSKAFEHIDSRPVDLPAPERDTTSIFFHLQYHPDAPPSTAIQRAWRDCVFTPPYARPLPDIVCHNRAQLGVQRLIVAYNRPFNLGNLLSYRKIRVLHGPPVSSYGITN
jgi:hypothetical protein